MKYLIIGCNGMSGHMVYLYLYEQGHDVFGYDERIFKHGPSVIGSLYDTDKLAKIVKTKSFDAVINCTAIVNEFAESDKAKAVFINTFLPHFLEKITADSITIVVHRSTDCIFSGQKGSYSINDIPDARSFYAKSKALGELDNNKDITIRTSLIGPELDIDGRGLLNWFMKQKGEVQGFVNSIWTGLTVLEYARVVDCLARKKANGIFQCVPNYAISKNELLRLFNKHFHADISILPVENNPVDKSLIQEIGRHDLVIPDYESMIVNMAKWINAHKSLYPPYYYRRINHE